MALGYEGWLKLDNPEVMCLATGTAISRASNRIESNSGYGGRKNTSDAVSTSMGISYPRTYDFPIYDGSFDIEMNLGVRDLIFDTYITEPQNPFELTYSTRRNTKIEMDQNYWSSINIQASDGSFATCSLGFVGLTYDVPSSGNINYCGNQFGAPNSTFNLSQTDPLNPCSNNLSPIPFWISPPKMLYPSNPDVGGINDKCMDWSMDFSRDVVKFFSCENTATKGGSIGVVDSEAASPSFIASGPISITFDFTEMVGLAQAAIQSQLRPDGEFYSVDILGRRFNDLELNSRSDNIVSQDSLAIISYSYNVYGNIEFGTYVQDFPDPLL